MITPQRFLSIIGPRPFWDQRMTSVALVTGFEPFGGFADNPSATVAQALDGATLGGFSIVGRVLPVVLEGQRARVEALLDEMAPSLVIALGLAGDAEAIRLERQAANRIDFAIPDNGGARPQTGLLVPDAPPALSTTLAVTHIAAALADSGIGTRLSDDAGTYLCNATLFYFLDAIRRRGRSLPCGFIHLPPSALVSLSRQQHAVRLAIEAQAEALVAPRRSP
jgi:pyroglutamyl-peptidase